jgi:prepilin-type N-terminal cleavage/methylation domain-containing protein
MKLSQGFTLVELLLVMAIIAVLTGIATFNLSNTQHKSQLTSTVETVITDIKAQQVKSMVGDGEGTGTATNFGIRYGSSNYTLYRTSYGTSNYVVTLPSTISISFASTSADLVFLKGSGEIPGYSNSTAVLTLRDTVDGSQKVIQLNRYGAITSVN